MTRLFIRFYVGILLILFLAWLIQFFIFKQPDEQNLQVIKHVYSGGFRLARDRVAAATDPQMVIKDLQAQFDFPLRLIERDGSANETQEELVFYQDENGYFFLTPLSNEKDAILFGPLPEFVKPGQFEYMSVLGLILLSVAIGIAFLLRPVAKQLSLVERTASQIAEGDFAARIDERKASSARNMARAFNRMASEIEAFLKTQRELLQCVSHELRTPLSRIHFALDLIRESQDEAENVERLNAIENSVQELDELVGELLRYIRLETISTDLELEQLDLLEIVQRLTEKYSLIFPNARFEIGPVLKSGNLSLTAERITLERALGNLIANAGRFCKNKVQIEADLVNGNIQIAIADDGPGISEADRTRVFEPFVRLETADSGAGLGLAIVKRIINNHGGSVSISESSSGGCLVRTSWPTSSDDKRCQASI